MAQLSGSGVGTRIRGALLVWCLLDVPATLAADYKTADEAMAAAAPHIRARNYAASREPLEAALRLAPDNAYRIRVYEALVSAYRELPQPEKFVEAAEFVIAHADTKAKRSLMSSSLTSFLFERGKLEEAIGKYEARLKGDPEDVVALGVLNTAYSRVRRDAQRGAAVGAKLAEVNKKLATRRAESLERDAGAAPRLAAHYYKEAAVAWLDAENIPRALAAAKSAKAGPPEDRSPVLKYFWHQSLGDVFAAAGEAASAKAEYEAAMQFAPGEPNQKSLQQKLDKLAKDKK